MSFVERSPGKVVVAGEGTSLSAAYPRRRSALGPFASAGWSIAAVVLALVVWESLWRAHVFAPYDLPGPSQVWHTWRLLAERGVLWHHTRATLSEALLGFLAAFVLAALLGYPLAKSRRFASILSPYIAATQAMPMLALAPLLVVWFGLGLLSKTLICMLIVFFPMLVNIAVGLRNVDRSVLEAAWTEGAGRWASLWRIEVPLAGRTILAGVRMGLTLAMTGAIVAEFVAASSGLGYLMQFARSQYDAPLLFAAAITVVACAVVAYVVIGIVEHVLIDWD
jgi:NitT/TauT family transport system permease protein